MTIDDDARRSRRRGRRLRPAALGLRRRRRTPPRSRRARAGVRGPVRQVRPRPSCSAASRSIGRSAPPAIAELWPSATSPSRAGRNSPRPGQGARGRVQGPGRPQRAGDMFERARPPGGPLPVAFPERAAAAAANGGASPPDLSVIAKARTYERGFPWFLIDIFTQYPGAGRRLHHRAARRATRSPPQGVDRAGGQVLQQVFPRPRHRDAAADQRRAGRISEERGRPPQAPETVDQYAKDVAAFLMWAAEPHLEAAQADRLQDHDLPARLRRPALLHQEAHLVARRRPRDA